MTAVEVDRPESPAPSLAGAMRHGSAAEHEAAEGSPFMTALLDGRIAPSGYGAYLARLRAVYAALETAVAAHAGDPLVDAVRDPALERLARLEADLAVWLPAWTPETPLDSPATAAYVRRLEGATWGGALVAHHYTRYLGDLSGGQAIGRILARTYGLESRGGDGVAFYAFPEVPRVKPYKDAYRARLDALGLTPGEVERVVEEVRVAFRLNQALFAELSADLGEHLR